MVHLDLEVTNVEELLQQQVQSLHQAGFLSEVEEPLRLLMEREAVHSTAMGSGAAFPHARWEGCTEPVVAVSRLSSPISFGESETNPVDVVFMILAPEADPSRHVRILGRLAKLVQRQEIMDKLRNATDEGAFLSHLHSALT